jgi:hypothetical protein
MISNPTLKRDCAKARNPIASRYKTNRVRVIDFMAFIFSGYSKEDRHQRLLMHLYLISV